MSGNAERDFKVGDTVKRTDTERSGQIVEVLSGHAARVQWPSGKEDWLPISLLTRADEAEETRDKDKLDLLDLLKRQAEVAPQFLPLKPPVRKRT